MARYRERERERGICVQSQVLPFDSLEMTLLGFSCAFLVSSVP